MVEYGIEYFSILCLESGGKFLLSRYRLLGNLTCGKNVCNIIYNKNKI